MEKHTDAPGYNYYKAFEGDRVRIESFARYLPPNCHHPAFISLQVIDLKLISYQPMLCKRCGMVEFIPLFDGRYAIATEKLKIDKEKFHKYIIKPYLERLHGNKS